MSNIRDSIKKLSKPNHDGYSVLCTVDSVNLTDLTCYCLPLNGEGDLQGVKLMANVENGFTLIPEVGSKVIVSFESDQIGFVSMFSGVSEIRLNGVVNGGLTNINDLKAALNLLQSNILTLQAATFAAISVYSAALDGGASAAAFNAVLYPLINLATIENTTVKHGNG